MDHNQDDSERNLSYQRSYNFQNNGDNNFNVREFHANGSNAPSNYLSIIFYSHPCSTYVD